MKKNLGQEHPSFISCNKITVPCPKDHVFTRIIIVIIIIIIIIILLVLLLLLIYVFFWTAFIVFYNMYIFAG